MIKVSFVWDSEPCKNFPKVLAERIPELTARRTLSDEKALCPSRRAMQWTYSTVGNSTDGYEEQAETASKLREFLRSYDCAAFGVTTHCQDLNRPLLFQFDADMTFYQHELIDELGSEAGCFDEISEITRQAMEGRYDFAESLSRRVALLKGLNNSVLDKLAGRLRFSSGIEKTVKFLVAQGHYTGIASGGFLNIIGRLKEQFGLNYVEANRLAVADSELTGKMEGKVVDAAAKATILRFQSRELGVPLENTVAVGDGANDLAALRAAAFGVAYQAKEALRKEASGVINSSDISLVLYLAGFSESDIEKGLRQG